MTMLSYWRWKAGYCACQPDCLGAVHLPRSPRTARACGISCDCVSEGCTCGMINKDIEWVLCGINRRKVRHLIGGLVVAGCRTCHPRDRGRGQDVDGRHEGDHDGGEGRCSDAGMIARV